MKEGERERAKERLYSAPAGGSADLSKSTEAVERSENPRHDVERAGRAKKSERREKRCGGGKEEEEGRRSRADQAQAVAWRYGEYSGISARNVRL